MATLSDVGKSIGLLSAKQTDTQDQLQSDELAGSFNIVQNENLQIEGTLTVTKFSLPSTSFVLDHPVYCYLDSPTLELDGGYAALIGGTFSLPVSMPVTFSGGTSGTEVLYTTSF